jgi:hypothetical protein
MTIQDNFHRTDTRSAGPGGPLRLVLESLAVIAVATLLVFVPSSAGPQQLRAGAGPDPEIGSATALDRLASHEVEAQRARRLP